jgi:4'-phosphopantetheinyl transferase
MTDIWYSRMDNITEPMVNRYREALDPEMQQEIMRYRQESDRKSRVLARKIIQLFLNTGDHNNDTFQFVLDKYKKPSLPGGPFFNISHSGNYAMVGFSEQPVGVDIEEKKAIDWELIAAQFHATEQQYINEQENQQDAFYRIWARKEAYLKAVGVGILKGIKTVNALEDIIIDEAGAWQLHDIEIDPGYASAVCIPVSKQKNNIQIKNINPTLTTSQC